MKTYLLERIAAQQKFLAMTLLRASKICSDIEGRDYTLAVKVDELDNEKYSVRISSLTYLGRHQLDWLLEIATGRLFNIEADGEGKFTIVIS